MTLSLETRIAALEEQVNPKRVVMGVWWDRDQPKPSGKVLANQVAAFAKLRGVSASVVQPLIVSWKSETA